MHALWGSLNMPTTRSHTACGRRLDCQEEAPKRRRRQVKKEILGWIFNRKDYTMHLPTEKIQKITNCLKAIQNCKRKIPRKKLLAGGLEQASFGILGRAGLFSPVQEALQGKTQWIKITPALTQCFKDWCAMIKQMAKQPTHVKQLIKEFPAYIGYSNSCGLGTGGVWTSRALIIPPMLWHLECPKDIKLMFQNSLLTMNDLELAGMVLEWLVLECLIPCFKFLYAIIFCDNTLAVS